MHTRTDSRLWFSRKCLSNLSTVQKILLFILIAILLASLIKAGYYTIHYGGTDLRVRTVGARLLNTGHSPYFYKWSMGEPETLLNPNDKELITNGVSVAPGVLFLQSVFNSLHYKTIRILWTIIQYLLLGFIFLSVLSRPIQDQSKKLYVILIGSIFFACSGLWFMNIERGQVYILYAFFFCLLWELISNKKSWMQFAGGIIFALAIYCRPSFVILTIPFLFQFNRSFIVGFFLGGALFAIHAFLYAAVWRDYFSVMAIYTGLDHGAQAINTSTIHYPEIVEGCNNLGLYKESYFAGGIYPFHHYFQHSGLPKMIYILVYATIAGVMVFLFRNKLSFFNAEKTILFGFLLYIISEYLIPVNRAGYNVIQWVFPVLLMLRTLRFNQPEFILLLVGLFLIISFPFYFPHLHDLGELLMVYCLIRHLKKGADASERPSMRVS